MIKAKAVAVCGAEAKLLLAMNKRKIKTIKTSRKINLANLTESLHLHPNEIL